MKLTKHLSVLSILFAAFFALQPVPDAAAQCADGAEPIFRSSGLVYFGGGPGHRSSGGSIACQRCEDGSYPHIGAPVRSPIARKV